MNAQIQNITHIIFDFDYTLADSSRGVLSCCNYALRKLGFPDTSYDTSCRTIGLSLRETYAALTGEPAGKGDEFVRLFVEHAEEVMADSTVLLEGIPAAIRTLKAMDYTLSIVSTKFRYRIETILSRENLLDPFSIIVGGEDVSKHKPDPESLLLALVKLGAPFGKVIYVGDSLVDAQTAATVKIPFIPVLSGVTPRDKFKGYEVLDILKTARDLPGWIKRAAKRDED